MGDPINLDKFRQVDPNLQIVGKDGGELQTVEKGNFFGRLFSVRSSEEKRTNIEITKSFRDSLVKEYGERVTNWAFEGKEGRFTNGRPLSGYRVQQILERAQSAKFKDDTALARLVTERAPVLLDEALARAKIELPEGIGSVWRQTLETEITRDIRNSEKFKESGKLETHQFNREFQNVVDNIVLKYKDAIPHIGEFEERQKAVLQRIDGGNAPVPESNDGFTWGETRPKDLQRCFFAKGYGNDYVKEFLREFGTGEGKIDDIYDYYDEKILPRAREQFEKFFGKNEPERISTYEGVVNRESGQNGHYTVHQTKPRPFVDVIRMDLGNVSPEVRDEKFHISVHTDDVGKAYKALAPILLGEDCPIKHWKVVDVEGAKLGYEKSLGTLNSLDTDEIKAQYTPEQIDNIRKEYTEQTFEAKRLIESCQFTIYAVVGKDSDGETVGPQQEGKDFGSVLIQIEEALTSAGVRPFGTPGSDEGLGRFVSFRMERVTLNPGDPGYPEARERQGIPEGQPVKVEVDRAGPTSHDKAKFVDSPFYKAQVGLRSLNEVDRLRDTLSEVAPPQSEAETRRFLSMLGEVNKLGKALDGLEMGRDISFEDWNLVDDRNDLLKSEMLEHLHGHMGIGDEVRGARILKQFAELLPSIGELILDFSNSEDPKDPDLLDRLQAGLAGFNEVKRDVLSLDNVPQGTVDYLQFVENELTSMLQG